MGGLPDKARTGGLGLVLGLVASGMLISALTGDRGLVGVHNLRRELAEAEKNNFELVQKISRIRQEIHALKYDDAALERAARRQAHLVRPGEILYRLSPANP